MKNTFKHNLKVMFALCFALIISIFVGKTVFVSNTPQIRQGAGAYIAQSVSSFIDGIFPNKNNKTKKDKLNELEKIAYSTISTGVSAREKLGAAQVRYELDKVKWLEYSYTLRDGSKLIIKVAEGQEAPPQSVVEQIQQ